MLLQEVVSHFVAGRIQAEACDVLSTKIRWNLLPAGHWH